MLILYLLIFYFIILTNIVGYRHMYINIVGYRHMDDLQLHQWKKCLQIFFHYDHNEVAILDRGGTATDRTFIYNKSELGSGYIKYLQHHQWKMPLSI
jgi:hypothetical protein